MNFNYNIILIQNVFMYYMAQKSNKVDQLSLCNYSFLNKNYVFNLLSYKLFKLKCCRTSCVLQAIVNWTNYYYSSMVNNITVLYKTL